jgi:hypothetical protein
MLWAVVLACSSGDAPQTGEPADAPPSPIPQSVRDELVQLGMDDQAIRQNLTPERMQDTAFAKQMLHDDSVRTSRLRTIIEEYGWPDSVRAGSEAAKAAFLILQHSPVHEFQQEMLPTIEDLAERGAIPRDEAALLVDRVLVRQGRPQRYGTQFSLVDGRLVMDSVVDPSGLDERRRHMGLPTMDEYVRMLEQVYQAEVVRHP